MMSAAALDQLFLRIDPVKISFLRFILEGYDGLAIMSTIDQKSGTVVLRFPGDNTRDIFALLTSIAAGLKK